MRRLTLRLLLLHFVALVLLHFLARLSFGRVNAADTTESLVRTCEVAVKFPSPDDIKKAPAAEQAEISLNAAYCLGYFSGILDLNSLYSGGMHTFFCAPKQGFSKIEAVKIFLKYTADHPQFAKESGRSIAVSALADVLPCY